MIALLSTQTNLSLLHCEFFQKLMGLRMMWFLLFSLILPITWASCPDSDRISPCWCEDIQGLYSIGVTCGVLESYESIGKAVEVVRGRKDVYSFTIEDTVLDFIPHDAFRGLEFKVLEITRSTLQSLTDTDVAFEGLEDYMEIIRTSETTILSDWDWSIIKNLKKLEKLEIDKGNVKYIDDALEQMSAATMKEISFDINEIEYLGDKAFAGFTNLKMLTLNHNMIKEVKRSMIADPAPEFGMIDLGANQLRNLPADFFTNMPNLKIVGLAYNKMLFLDEKIFKPVWHHLQRFNVIGNHIRCDCRLSWILKQSFPGYFNGQCANPQNLRERNINSLSPNELFCFFKK